MNSKKVGPGHPPVDTRFRKGQSGNPKGRPKGRRKAAPEETRSAFDIAIEKTLTVTQGGVTRELTVEEALQHRTYQDAIGGSRAAQNEVLKMILKRDKALAAHRVSARLPLKFPQIFAGPTYYAPGNADRALRILGIACLGPTREEDAKREPLLLEPWAVQKALSRRRGGSRLGEHQVEEIKRFTQDAGLVRWPRSVRS